MIAAAEGTAEAPRDSLLRYYFRFDPKARRLITSRGTPSPATTRWLEDTLAASAGAYDSMWYFAAIVGGPAEESTTLAVYRRRRDGQFVGGVTDLAALTPIRAEALDKMPLLPRSLTRGVLIDSAGGVRIGDARGRTIYVSDTHSPSLFVGRETIAPWLGSLWAEATLRPEIASRLIAGGVPRSRLPIAMGVFAVAAALTVAALLLIRRESELARLRTDLVAGVSHELRTPLAQIRMFSETLLLERVRSDEERHRSLAIIDQEARRLTHLVENLLHFSRTERQLGRVVLRPVDLRDVVAQATESFMPLAAAGATMVRLEPGPPLSGVADADAIRQIVLNLLDNAAKYGAPDQTVIVGLTAHGGKARLTVDDQGPGIPVKERERVWERFFRLPRDRDGAAAGTGIGLAVVRELIALHGGRAWVEDSPDFGGRFVVEWPLALQAGEP
jgi:signal transduction histidine kinase